MSIGKSWRVGGFIAALTASAGLIAAATGATGAYFTDSHAGSLSAGSGHLHLSIDSVSGGATASGPDNLALDFQNLYPTDYRTEQINYTTDSSVGNEDIWLVFPTDTAAKQNIFDLFTGSSGSYGGGGLGRYGHFAVADSHGGQAFSSYNLSSYSPATDCVVTSDGHAVGTEGAASDNAGAQPCAVPQKIKLASNLASGTTGHVALTFGLTQRQTQQDQVEFNGHAVAFEIVATQPGVAP